MLDPGVVDFPLRLEQEVKKWHKEYIDLDHKRLRFHQYLITKYMTSYNKLKRGICLIWEPGVGKSIGALSIALALKRRCVVIVTASLKENFKNQLDKMIKNRLAKDNSHELFEYISMNASNAIEQLTRVTGGGTLDGMTVIIDEVHELLSSIINSDTKNAPAIYNLIMRSKDIKLICLSGTPINKNPYQLVPLVNMLRGSQVLPNNYNDFKTLFVGSGIPADVGKKGDMVDISTAEYQEQDNGGLVRPPIGEVTKVTSPDNAAKTNPINKLYIMNKEKLQNRIFGLFSYVEPDWSNFPTLKDNIIVNVPMELDKQWPAYKSAKVKEAAELARIKRGKTSGEYVFPGTKQGIGIDRRKVSSSYKKETRAISNVFRPKDATDNITGESISPKIDKIIENVNKHKRQKGLIYSQFKNDGVYAVAEKLKNQQWEEFTLDMLSSVEEIPKNTQRYMIIHGGITDLELRQKMIDYFNRYENLYGDYVQLILVTSTGATGININAGRHCHILEPYWDYSRILQIIARLVRDNSHKNLPEDQRDVQAYVYMSISPMAKESAISPMATNNTTIITDYTTDQELYYRSIKLQAGLDEWKEMLKEVCIECPHLSEQVGLKINCRKCNPSGTRLYTRGENTYFDDITASDPCEQLQKKELSVQSITVEGIDYKWATSNESVYKINIYKFDINIDGYVRVRENDPLFVKIFDAIMDIKKMSSLLYVQKPFIPSTTGEGKYVTGLMTLAVMINDKWDKQFVILGEGHSKEGSCIPKSAREIIQADNYFFGLLDSVASSAGPLSAAASSATLDVYLEYPFNPTSKEYQERYPIINDNQLLESYLSWSIYKLVSEKCLYAGGLCSKYKDHVRFHNVDLRSDTLAFPIKYLNDIKWNYIKYVNYPKDDETRKKIMKWFSNPDEGYDFRRYFNPDILKKDLHEYISGSSKIKKQLDNIPDKYTEVVTILNRDINKNIDIIVDLLSYDKIKMYYTNPNKMPKNIEDILDDVVMIFIDAYLFARSFRKYDKVEPKTAIGFKSEPKNNVLYTGNAHSNVYLKWLDELGFKAKYYRTSISQNIMGREWSCVSITDLDIKWIV